MKYILVEPQIWGLKCDTPSCGYRDEGVKLSKYWHYIDESCPNCGASLLTLDDYTAVMRSVAMFNKINELANRWLPEWLLRRLTSGKAQCTNIEMDGSGKLKVNQQ